MLGAVIELDDDLRGLGHLPSSEELTTNALTCLDAHRYNTLAWICEELAYIDTTRDRLPGNGFQLRGALPYRFAMRSLDRERVCPSLCRSLDIREGEIDDRRVALEIQGGVAIAAQNAVADSNVVERRFDIGPG